MSSSWWDKGGGSGQNEAVAHTPDPNRYHYPQADPGLAMRVGRSVAPEIGMGIMIPRARHDGRSRGFDGTKAGAVHVDPDAPDGGVVVDLSLMNGDKVDMACAGVDLESGFGRAEAFYRMAGKPMVQQDVNIPDPTAMTAQTVPAGVAPGTTAAIVPGNPVMPGSYVAPKANQDGTQGQAQPGAQALGHNGLQGIPSLAATQVAPAAPVALPPPPQPSQTAGEQGNVKMAAAPVPAPVAQPIPVAPMPAPVAQPIAVAPVPAPVAQPIPVAAVPAPIAQPDPVAAPPAPPQMVIDSDQLVQLVANAVAAQLPPALVAPELPAPLPPPAPVEEPPQQAIPEVAAADFKVLGIPFIESAEPKEPSETIIFDLGHSGGQMSANYHAVVEGNGCLALIYDTRHKAGNQYTPPNRGETSLIAHWPSESKKFNVASMGMQFAMGVFDVVVLVFLPEVPEEKPAPASIGDPTDD